ncbi:MAG: alpha/beta hydrolase, partial [Cyanobacteria bacterium P01_E01_bin.34]
RAALVLGTISASLFATSAARAAEEIVVTAGAANRVFSVSAIETYAETGELTENLEPYLGDLSPEASEALREAISFEVPVEFVPFSQFLRTNTGESVLNQAATIVKPFNPNVSGSQALRAAFTLAAQDGSFSIVELLRMYPTSRLSIDQTTASDRFDNLKELSQDMQLLLAAAGVDVNFSDARLEVEGIAIDFSEAQFVDIQAVQNLFVSGQEYVGDLRSFARESGLTDLELDSPTAPEGDITIPKADLYNLYQQFETIRTEAEVLFEESGIQIERLDAEN